MASKSSEETEIVKRIKEVIGETFLEGEIPRPRRVFIRVGKDAFRKATNYIIKQLDFTHISTITGVDAGEDIEVIYHLTREGRIGLSLKVLVPKNKPTLPTTTDLIPGATLYEREVHDLLGVTFEGHPNLSPLILPEGWPQGIYPLRKEWSVEKIREKIMKEGKQ